MGGCRNLSVTIPFVQPEVDIGSIIMWFGTEAAIPAGWQKCDGTNGTPDLTTSFPRGASADVNKGAAAGNINHDHTFTSNTHVHQMLVPPSSQIQTGAGLRNLTDSVAVSGTSDQTDGRPPFVRVFFIQKVA